MQVFVLVVCAKEIVDINIKAIATPKIFFIFLFLITLRTAELPVATLQYKARIGLGYIL